MRASLCCLCGVVMLLGGMPVFAFDPPEGEGEDDDNAEEVTISTTWTMLHTAGRRAKGVRPLPPNGPIKQLEDLKFTGPQPGHPFVLGEFVADGKWGVVSGGIQLVDGYNAALNLARAEDFELDGTIEMQGYGGWFLLVGWDQGRGYSVSNITLKESPSSWFITEYRGDTAIPDAHEHVADHEWRREQPFRVTVRDNELEFEVGKVKVLEKQQLANYSTGDVVFGVYDTRYGPRPVRIRKLRIRALE